MNWESCNRHVPGGRYRRVRPSRFQSELILGGGTVTVSSAPAVGSSFVIWLPLEGGAEPDATDGRRHPPGDRPSVRHELRGSTDRESVAVGWPDAESRSTTFPVARLPFPATCRESCPYAWSYRDLIRETGNWKRETTSIDPRRLSARPLGMPSLLCTGYWVLGTGYWVLGTRFRSSSRTADAGRPRLPDSPPAARGWSRRTWSVSANTGSPT